MSARLCWYWSLMIVTVYFSPYPGLKAAPVQKFLGMASAQLHQSSSAGIEKQFYDSGLYLESKSISHSEYFCQTGRIKRIGWESGGHHFETFDLIIGFEKFEPESLWYDPVSRKIILTGGNQVVRYILQGLVYCRTQVFVGLGGELELIRSDGSESMMIHLSRNFQD